MISLYENKKIIGVKIGNDIIKSSCVVSNAGFYNTYNMIGEIELTKKMFNAVKGSSVKYSVIYVGFNRSAEELNLDSSCHWYYNGLDDYNYDVSKWIEKRTSSLDEFVNNPSFFYYEFPAGKDNTYSKRNPDKSNCIIILLTETKWFEDNEDASERIINSYLPLLFKERPDLKKYTDYVKLWTPLDTKKHINSPYGESEGVNMSQNYYCSSYNKYLQPRTKIKGLYLTGQDCLSCGVAGALSGGWMAAESILGYDDIISLFTRSLRRDLIK